MGNEPGGIPSAGQVGGIIPHFYFDVIGRILPGTFFIIGLAFLLLPASALDEFKCSVLPPVREESGTYLIFAGTVCIFGLALFSYIVGSLLGAVSHFLFERCRTMDCRDVFSNIRGKSCKDSPHPIEEIINQHLKKHFGVEFLNPRTDENEKLKHESLADLSKLCTYYVWQKNVNLGQMTTRWDAENLGNRNIMFGAGALALTRAVQMLWCHDQHPAFLLIMALITVFAIRQNEYLRRTQVFGRFLLFLSVSGPEELEKGRVAPAKSAP
jgi:hypothetical protein